MLKRVTWFLGGAAAGAAGATAAKRKVARTAAQLPPVRAARRVATTVRSASDRVASAVRDGRQAMHETEVRLRAKRDGEEVAPIEVIDGRIVATGEIKPGQVIVLRDVRDERLRNGDGKSATPRRRRRA